MEDRQKHQTAAKRRHRSRSLRLRKPVALKLVIVLMLLTVGASLWQGTRDYKLSKIRLERLKNEDGVRFVRQLAIFARPFWLKTDGEGNLVKVNGETVKADTESIKKSRIDLEAKLKRHASHEAGKGILDVVLFSAKRKNTFYASLSEKGSFGWTPGKQLNVPFAKEAGVSIVEGRLSGTAARTFTSPITMKDKTIVGKVVVYLSAEDLQAAEDNLRVEVIRNVIICAFVAAAFSILLGSFLTRPIRTLAQDIRAVSTGDLDRRSSVDSADEVGDLARTFNRMVASLRESQERKAVQKALEKELGIARKIQKGLLPETIPQLNNWEIAAFWTPAKEVGGDYYDFIDLGGGNWGAVVADVSGKGVPASLIMSMTRCLLRLASGAGQGPSGTLGLIDDVISPDLKDGMFVSMVYLHFSEQDGKIRLLRAGHNPPVILRGDTAKQPELCKTPGVAIGLRAGFGHQSQTEADLSFEVEDSLILYSDGIVEAMNENGKEFGLKRFLTVLNTSKKLSAKKQSEYIIAQLSKWRGKAAQSDDITLVVLKRKK